MQEFFSSHPLDTLVTLTNNAIELGVIFAFAWLFLDNRRFWNCLQHWKRFVLLLSFFIVDSIYLIIAPSGVAILVFLFRLAGSMLFRSLYIFALFKTPLLSFKRISALTILDAIFGITLLLELIYGSIASLFGILVDQWLLEIVFVFFMRLLIVLIYKVVHHFYTKAHYDTARKAINFLFVLSIGLTFAITLWLNDTVQSHYWVALSILIGAVSILVIVVLYESFSKKQEREQSHLLSLQNKLMNERLEGDKRLMDAVHQTRHDLQKHLDYVHSLLDEARTFEAQQYIQQITKPVKADTAPVRTGCPTIDTVLQIEQSKASAQGITMEIVAHGLPENCITPTDSNCILGNLLDNAIEAQADVPEEERHVQVSIRQKHDFLIIHIRNTVKENPLLNNEKLLTTKTENANLHGIGLKSVETAVKRYDGELSYGFENGIFTVSVLLCSNIA